MHNHLTAFQPDKLYLLVCQAGFNGRKGQVTYKDSVAGPVSHDVAKKARGAGNVRAFVYDPEKVVEFRPRGDKLEAFYDTPEGHRIAAMKAEAERKAAAEAEARAQESAKRAAARARVEAERAEYESAKALVERYEADQKAAVKPEKAPVPTHSLDALSVPELRDLCRERGIDGDVDLRSKAAMVEALKG